MPMLATHPAAVRPTISHNHGPDFISVVPDNVAIKAPSIAMFDEITRPLRESAMVPVATRRPSVVSCERRS
jgi:hypothetical protein